MHEEREKDLMKASKGMYLIINFFISLYFFFSFNLGVELAASLISLTNKILIVLNFIPVVLTYFLFRFLFIPEEWRYEKKLIAHIFLFLLLTGINIFMNMKILRYW